MEVIEWKSFESAPKTGEEILTFTKREPHARNQVKILRWSHNTRDTLDSKMGWFDQYNHAPFDTPHYWAQIDLPEVADDIGDVE